MCYCQGKPMLSGATWLRRYNSIQKYVEKKTKGQIYLMAFIDRWKVFQDENSSILFNIQILQVILSIFSISPIANPIPVMVMMITKTAEQYLKSWPLMNDDTFHLCHTGFWTALIWNTPTISILGQYCLISPYIIIWDSAWNILKYC